MLDTGQPLWKRAKGQRVSGFTLSFLKAFSLRTEFYKENPLQDAIHSYFFPYPVRKKKLGKVYR